MKSKKNLRLTFKIILLLLIALTVSFIFGQSMLNKEASQENSDGAKGFLALIFPPGTAIGDFIQENVRKIAHFAEFFILGSEIALYVFLYCRNIKTIVSAAFVSFVVGTLDETIQIFSNRGPSIVDVWIDVFGFITAYLIVILSAYLVLRIRNNRLAKQK